MCFGGKLSVGRIGESALESLRLRQAWPLLPADFFQLRDRLARIVNVERVIAADELRLEIEIRRGTGCLCNLDRFTDCQAVRRWGRIMPGKTLRLGLAGLAI